MNSSLDGSVASPAIPCDGIARTFTLLALLSGSGRGAEAAMHDAIAHLECGHLTADRLFFACVRSVIAAPYRYNGGEDVDSLYFRLPPELKNILLLPSDLRHPYVLRLLAGLSAAQCVQFDLHDVDQRACAAARELARIAYGQYSPQ